jgi:[ribosomal protein S18]-alanine N-acetyltransferase
MLSQAFSIRRMGHGDIEGVLAIEQQSFTLPWTRQLFLDEFKHPETSFFYVLEQNQQVLGYAGFWLVQDEAHITNLAVHPDFRREHRAHLLLSHLLNQAKQLGAKRATLEVRSSNTAALGLYQKMGFEIIAIRAKYYPDNQEDALILWHNDLSRVVSQDPRLG